MAKPAVSVADPVPAPVAPAPVAYASLYPTGFHPGHCLRHP